MNVKSTVLTYKEQNKIIDEALKEHYRETMERKRVPPDYLLMFTEGGESNAVADAIAKRQDSISFKAGTQVALERIEQELVKLYQQYDKRGKPTDDDGAVRARVYMISNRRWRIVKNEILNGNNTPTKH